MYKIAVIDDNETWCFVMAHLFHKNGYQVLTFTDAASFLPRAHGFDLALVDFSIPVRSFQPAIDGPEVISYLKQQEQESPLLVLISAYLTQDVLPYADSICPEADAYLSKCASLPDILSQVQQLITSHQN